MSGFGSAGKKRGFCRLIYGPVYDYIHLGPGDCRAWGEISPMYHAMMSSAKSAIDREIRIVRARAILRESSALLPRERWRSAEPRLTKMAMSRQMTSGRSRYSILRPSV